MKLFAVILILSSSVMMAFLYIRQENRHISDLKNAIDIMTEIKNRTLQYFLPFDETVRICISDGITSDCLASFLSAEYLPPPEAWKKAVFSEKIYLNNDEKKILADFGCTLCTCSREQIPDYSEKFIGELSKKYNLLNENKEKKIKVISALSMTVGLTAIMVLI